jgi:6-phosphofructokinase 2
MPWHNFSSGYYMIVTVTFNPAIDKSATIAALIPEKKMRCSQPVFEPGGGGVNVARAIGLLGHKARAVYMAGGHSGRFYTSLLEKEGVQSVVIPIAGNTRENLIIMEESTGQQFRFGMPGPAVTEEECAQCLKAIDELEGITYLVTSGSLAPGMSPGIMRQLAQMARKKQARFIADTSGQALKEAVAEGVFLLKPNLGELSALAGKQEVNAEEVDDIARDLIANRCCEVIVVSMGAGGAMLITKDEVYTVSPPAVKRKSTVGAGDSMVAGMVLSLEQGRSLKEVLQYGVACGTAATMNAGTALCRMEDVERLYEAIRRR